MYLLWIESFCADLDTQIYNHPKLSNKHAKKGFLDCNILLPDITDIVLCLYFSIYNYIVSDQYNSTYLIAKKDNDTAEKVHKLLKKHATPQIQVL